MQLSAQGLTSLFRTIVVVAVAAVVMTATPSISAQNSVPPTARQAATMPQFAAKLARGASRVSPPAAPRASYKRPADALARRNRGWMPGGNDLYDNGPINGTTDAWTINFGFVVSDSFTYPSGANSVTGLTFGAWTFPGDVLENVEISITSSEFGGTTYFDGVVNFSQSNCSGNQYGYNVCTETSAFSGPDLQPGRYWVNLQNAVVNDGDPTYWDENSGPSLASNNSVGTIPSEAFTVLGNECLDPAGQRPPAQAKAVTVPPSPTQTYRVIYNFTGAGDGADPQTGLVIDAAGNLYGTTAGTGPGQGGTVFKLSPSASGWRYSRLYSFSGADGEGPDSLVLGADGRLYGTTYGGGTGDGVLFGLSPAGHILPSVFANWMETLLYSFTGGSDGANPNGSIVLDSSGNIFGNARAGGTNHGGTLYEFTNGALQVLHAFPGFQGDGNIPIGVVNGADGLYGLTSRGGANGMGTLYTTAGGYQVLYSFGPYYQGSPVNLAADQAGNLYGTDSFIYRCFGVGGADVFQFSPPGWNATNLMSFESDGELSPRVSTDASGNVYGTTDFGGQYSEGSVFKLTCCWTYTELHDFSGQPSDGDMPSAAPVVDAQGNIYGTTSAGGAYGQGTVWEISP